MIRRTIFDVDYNSDLGYPRYNNITCFKLNLKVHLSPMNPEHGKPTTTVFDIDNQKSTIQRWKDDEWETFKSEFKKDAERHLNWPKMELYLLPRVQEKVKMSQIQILYFVSRDPVWNKMEPFLQCGLTVELVKDKSKAHVAFRVIRLQDGAPKFRSFDTQVDRAEDWGILTNRDIDIWNTSPNEDGVIQSVIAHELGHVLGLQHIGCNNNAAVCYGLHGTPQYSNLMGQGNLVTSANASPWLKRIPWHARSLNWFATTKNPHRIDL